MKDSEFSSIKRSPTLGIIPGLINRFDHDFSLEMFKRANFSRHFELKVKEALDLGLFRIPIYLSIGTEFNSAALSMVLEGYMIIKTLHDFADMFFDSYKY